MHDQFITTDHNICLTVLNLSRIDTYINMKYYDLLVYYTMFK